MNSTTTSPLKFSCNLKYPFGMTMPGRKFNSGDYRFGFNGMEMINEVNGIGNIYDYGFRIFNPRVGRFLSVDPLMRSFPWWSPYHFAGNTPIQAIDLDGLEIVHIHNNTGESAPKLKVEFTRKGEPIGGRKKITIHRYQDKLLIKPETQYKGADKLSKEEMATFKKVMALSSKHNERVTAITLNVRPLPGPDPVETEDALEVNIKPAKLNEGKNDEDNTIPIVEEDEPPEVKD